MHYTIQKVLCLIEEVVQRFKYVMKFKVSIHHVYVQEYKDTDKEWITCEYQLN